MQPIVPAQRVPLQSLPTFKQINAFTQQGLCKIIESTLDPLIKVLNKIGSSTETWGASLVTNHQLDLTPFTATLWAWPSSQFFTQWTENPSKPWADSFLRRTLWKTVSNVLLKSMLTTSTVFLPSTTLVTFHRRRYGYSEPAMMWVWLPGCPWCAVGTQADLFHYHDGCCLHQSPLIRDLPS